MEGMECRWDSIRPPADTQEVVCLLVIVRDHARQAALLADVVRQIDTIYGPLARRTPITRPRMKLKPTFAKVGVEMRAKLGRFDFAYLAGKWFYTVIGKLYFAFTSAGDHYLDRLVQLSDTLMIDGRINTIISGTAAQREALIAALGRFVKEEATSVEFLRTLAVCRLFLDNIVNIQTSWVTQGLKVCQLGLRFGGNDVGSIMMEENVVSQAGANFHASEEDLRRIIRGAGFTPKQRDTLYRTYFLN
jgi:hypothetical protein